MSRLLVTDAYVDDIGGNIFRTTHVKRSVCSLNCRIEDSE